MPRNDTTSEIVDAILKTAVAGTVIVSALTIPNIMIAFDKPLQAFFNKMDKRAQERELRRVVNYMKTEKLVAGNYEYGLKITNKGRDRITKKEFENLKIEPPKKWDSLWRIAFYDVPEKNKIGRQAFTSKLKQLGFIKLQRSVWIYPFPCRRELEIVTTTYNISRYTSLVEAPFIDSQESLIKQFKRLYPKIKF